MTAFGITTLAVFAIAMATGLSTGIFAIAINDPVLAWLSGGVAFAPIFLVVGRVWAKDDIRRATLSPAPRTAAKEDGGSGD